MMAWHVNAVRIPLNEDCWLNINGINPMYSGANYQQEIQKLVTEAHAAGLVVILDLHWNAPGTMTSGGQLNMADADHAPAFWTSVASSYKSDPLVIFDLYNEPHDISWSCWLSGCNSPGYMTAGMQDLVNAVRATGATNPLMLGGLAYANDLSGWLANKPTDPVNALVGSFHNYNFNACTSSSCWDSTIGTVAAQVPVITGELGENDCGGSYIDPYMSWADTNHVGYLAWTWNPGNCGQIPSLLNDYTGSPSGFGQAYHDHIVTLP